MTRVAIEHDDGRISTLEGRFAVVAVVSDVGGRESMEIVASGSASAYTAAMVGCQIAAKALEPFDTLDCIKSGEEGRFGR